MALTGCGSHARERVAYEMIQKVHCFVKNKFNIDDQLTQRLCMAVASHLKTQCSGMTDEQAFKAVKDYFDASFAAFEQHDYTIMIISTGNRSRRFSTFFPVDN